MFISVRDNISTLGTPNLDLLVRINPKMVDPQ